MHCLLQGAEVLVQGAAGKPVRIITRTAGQGEKLTTLDNAVRVLNPSSVLVCDEKGALSMAGVMGGMESEIHDARAEILDATGPEMKDGLGKASVRSASTSNILLEAAAWNFINIRKTANAHNLHSEAAFRFSRGVHPALTVEGLKRCLYWMAEWSGGQVAPGIVDEYPLPPHDPLVEITRLQDFKLRLETDPLQHGERDLRHLFESSDGEGNKVDVQPFAIFLPSAVLSNRFPPRLIQELLRPFRVVGIRWQGYHPGVSPSFQTYGTGRLTTGSVNVRKSLTVDGQTRGLSHASVGPG